MDASVVKDRELEELRYPVGRFRAEPEIAAEERERLIEEIAGLPGRLRAAVAGLSEEQLDTAYRPGGWTVRQVVHHLPDSHLNSYIRFKLAMTQDSPRIMAYDEAAWAELADARGESIEVSLTLLESLHRRWSVFLRSLDADDFARTFDHPENGLVTLDTNLQLYAWHGRHHVAHVTRLREREGWG